VEGAEAQDEVDGVDADDGPAREDISGGVSVSSCALSTSRASAGTLYLPLRSLRNPSAIGSSTANEAASVCPARRPCVPE
jgi:hypothetical protein